MKFSLRRLGVLILLILLIGSVAVGGLFLTTFDLNNFRVQISEAISIRLSQPVNLGHAHFSLKHGPSFAFDDIRIGHRSSSLHLESQHVFFRLEVLPLLRGEFRFTEILLEDPDLTLELRPTTKSTQTGRIMFDQSLVSGDMIKSIRIRNGHFLVKDYRRSETPFLFAFEKMDMFIEDLGFRESSRIELEAEINCNGVRSPATVKGRVKADEANPSWNHARYELELDIRDFASDVLSQRYRAKLSGYLIHGRTDIHVTVSGSPATGLDFDTMLSGRDLGLLLPQRKTPVFAGKIAATGVWQNKNGRHAVDHLKIQFDDMKASGRFEINLAKSDPFLSLQLEAPRLALVDFNRFIPRDHDTGSGRLPEFSAGTFRLNRLEVAAPLSRLSGMAAMSAVNQLDFEISKGGLARGKSLNLADCNVGLQWSNGQIAVTKLELQTDMVHLSGSGRFDLKSGQNDSRLHLRGRTELNVLPLHSSGSDRKSLLPEEGITTTLQLDATYGDGLLKLNQSPLAVAATETILSGEWDISRAFSLRMDIPDLSLADLPGLSPAVRHIDLAGEMSARLQYKSGPDVPGALSGTLRLKGASLNIPGPLDPLNQLNGTLKLDWPRLEGKSINTRLGASPIILDLTVPNLRSPRIELHLQGDAIRADELIFRSRKHFLRNVDAEVVLTDDALILGPIHVRMDGGTDVTINGRIDNFPRADTRLTIDGRYGNIDEVIGLWISEHPGIRQKKNKHQPGLLEIEITTESGEIANLPFEDGKAHISYRDRTLVIHPLRFKSGPGFGIGQILVVYRDDRPPLLKISGHLEDFDAKAVYQQLLQRKGLVTGRLRGDFYLEGTAGNLKETFLPSSFGAFNYEVRDGILKKMRGLSEALTVFNIYPIFTSSGKERGVPFEQLRGNALLEKGNLKTEDLQMTGDVMNISMSGSQNLITSHLDFELGIMPLRTVDRLVTKIPLAGWILAGKDKSLVTAHFKIRGPAEDPEIRPIPIESASKQVLGIFERVLTLPVKIITDMDKVLE